MKCLVKKKGKKEFISAKSMQVQYGIKLRITDNKTYYGASSKDWGFSTGVVFPFAFDLVAAAFLRMAAGHDFA